MFFATETRHTLTRHTHIRSHKRGWQLPRPIEKCRALIGHSEAKSGCRPNNAGIAHFNRFVIKDLEHQASGHFCHLWKDADGGA